MYITLDEVSAVITIVDYGMGNLRSVQKALQYMNIPSAISSKPEDIIKSEGIIIPGVGAFPDAMDNIKKNNIDRAIKLAAAEDKPILGICLGMQLLFEESAEVKSCEGLGLLKGTVKKIEGNVKVPHMGWNSLKFHKPCVLLNGVKEGGYVYFVHSYYAQIMEEGILNAYSLYEKSIPAIVSKKNVFGIQFHPEKSGEEGMKILKNFWELIK